ncbi:MAG: DMT family transporter [Nocardioides sp.]
MLWAGVLLVVAILIEVAATTFLPKTEGFTNLTWSMLVIGGYGTSIWLLAVVVRQMPISIAYAVWSGAGTALVALIAYFFLGESLGVAKAFFLGLIVVGVVGLNLSGAH